MTISSLPMRVFTVFQITEIFNDMEKNVTMEIIGNFAKTVHETHDVIVRECDYCGKPMSASEANDYGTLCERCYMKEYYNE